MSQAIASRYIAAIFALAFIIRVAYAVIAPPFQAPDEYSHYSYLMFLHQEGTLPVQPNPAVTPEELEFHQPPLYYALASILLPSTTLVEGRPLLPLRFINIVFSMLTVVVAYHFASKVLKWNSFSVLIVCAVFALLPTYSYISATIRNGVLATFFASLGFYLCGKALIEDQGRKMAPWIWIGIVAGLALLSKLTAIAFVLAAGIMIVSTSGNWRNSLHRATWFGVGVVSTAGWWFARNWLLYGHPLKVIENGYEWMRPAVSWDNQIRSMVTIFKTFWAVFGRINEYYFADVYRFYWWFTGIAVLGIVLYILQRRHDVPARLVGLFTIAIGVSVAATLYYAHMYNSDQGRYMFPVLIPITAVLALGLNTIVPPRYHRWVLDTVIFAFAGINVVVLARLAAAYSQIG